MRFLKLLVVFIMLSNNVVYADMHDAKSLVAANEKILQLIKNIWDIAKGTGSDDKEAVRAITTSTFDMTWKFKNLVDFELLKNEMDSVNDRAVVKTRIVERVKELKGACENNIENINFNIAMLRNPGLLSETQRLRDQIVQSCDIAQHRK